MRMIYVTHHLKLYVKISDINPAPRQHQTRATLPHCSDLEISWITSGLFVRGQRAAFWVHFNRKMEILTRSLY